MLFYIIFGTNLLTGGLVPVSGFFAYFSVSQKRNTKRNETFGNVIFSDRKQTRRLGVEVRNATRRPRGRRVRPRGVGTPPPSWAPRSSTDVLLPPIYTYVPRKHPGAPRKHSSTAATFCTRDIPSRGLFQHSVGGGFDHGGLLHQHHSLSDDV